MNLREALNRILELANNCDEWRRLEGDEEAMTIAMQFVRGLPHDDELPVMSEIHTALTRVLHMAEASLEDTGDNPDANECRKVSQYIENVLFKRDENKVFNISQLSEQLFDNVMAGLDDIMAYIKPGVPDRIRQDITDTINTVIAVNMIKNGTPFNDLPDDAKSLISDAMMNDDPCLDDEMRAIIVKK